MWGKGSPCALLRGGECKLVGPLWKSRKSVWTVLSSLESYHVTCHSTPGQIPQDSRYRHTGSPMLSGALFTTAGKWNQSRRQSTDSSAEKMGFYSSVRKNEIMQFAGEWMEWENRLRGPRPRKTITPTDSLSLLNPGFEALIRVKFGASAEALKLNREHRGEEGSAVGRVLGVRF